MKQFIFTIGIIFLLLSCGSENTSKDYTSEVDEGTLKDGLYKNERLAWEMEIIDTWSVTKKGSLKTADAITKKYTGDSVDTKGIKILFSFEKDYYNNFQSNTQLYEGNKDDYKKTLQAIRNVLFDNYLIKHMTVDTVSSKEKIQGIEFDVFEIKIFHEGTDKPLANQIVYNCLRKGDYFTAIINSNNDIDRNRIIKAFKNSKFK